MTLRRIKRSLGRRQSLWWPFRRFRFGKRHTFALGAETMPCDGASFLCCSTFLFPVCGGHCSCLSQCLLHCPVRTAARRACRPTSRTSTGQAWSRKSQCAHLWSLPRRLWTHGERGQTIFSPSRSTFARTRRGCKTYAWTCRLRIESRRRDSWHSCSRANPSGEC